MTRTFSWLLAIAGPCLIGATVLAANPAAVADDGRETQVLLDRLSKLSEQIVASAQSPHAYRLQLDQGEVLVKLASRTKEGRDGWLRMAIDSYANAACQAPDAERQAGQWVMQVANYIAQTFPDANLTAYVMYKQVHVDHLRTLARNGGDTTRAHEDLCRKLIAFAESMPTTPEAQKALIEVAEAHEALKKTAEAKATYRALAAKYPGTATEKTARAAIWRLGLEGEVIELKLPQLYARPGDPSFNLKDLRGKPVLVYFWSSASEGASEDLQMLREIGDRHARHGLEVLFVNLDATPEVGKEYIANRLTGGTHLHQPGGVEGEVTARYGIKTLPETVLIGKDGALISRTSRPAGIDAAVTNLLGASGLVKRR